MRYFTIDEFDSPDKTGSGTNMNKTLLSMLDEARAIAGIPFKINSGFRTEKHNKKVGGKKNSSHLNGLAVDIHCNDNGNRQIILDSLRDVGFVRIGIAKTFIHCDIDYSKRQKRTWLY